MKLQRAFTERKRLTNYYEEITAKIYNVDFSNETSKPESGTYGIDIRAPKYNLDELLKEQIEAGNMLALFNAVIDEANAKSEARFILSQLTNLRRQSAVLKHLSQQQNGFLDSKEEYDPYKYDATGNKGVYVTKYFRPASTQNFTEMWESKEKEIHNFEDRLSEVNATTEVNVPQDVLDYLAKNVH